MSDPPLHEDADDAWQVALRPPLLTVRFREPQRVASWAIVGGGLRTARTIAWLGVRNADLPEGIDPAAFLAAQLAHAGLSDAVGLLTSRDLGAYVVHGVVHGHVSARCIATVGLGNALRAGDPPTAASAPGTINVLCRVSVPLGERASLEAIALAAEARTLALLEARVPSSATGRPATGTGTDCIAIASPFVADAAGAAYAGKHTAVGHVIGAAVVGALRRGVASWLAEQTKAEVQP
jgi:adenosylcobinamide amidohydrolase